MSGADAMARYGLYTEAVGTEGTHLESQWPFHFAYAPDRRGDVVMVMAAGSTDLRKAAEASGGGLAHAKLRKYASEMASITR